MEIHCPACQKQLILEDQYAGQMMKCPMCGATFTAPALPSYAAGASSLPGAPPSPPPAAPSFPTAPGAPASVPAAGIAPGYPPPTPQSAGSGAPWQPYAPASRSAETTKSCVVKFDPNVMQWIPVGAVLLIFIFSFFTWVWVGFGSVATASENAWQAAFGGYSVNSSLVDEKTRNPFLKQLGSVDSDDEFRPGVSVLTIFFVILLIPTLLIVAGAAVVGILNLAVPPNLHALVGLRWTIAGGLCLLLFFFLTLQLLVGFGMEHAGSQIADKRGKSITEMTEKHMKISAEKAKEYGALAYGETSDSMHRTVWLTVVWWLNLIAVLVSGFIIWLELRRTAPIPRLEFRY